MIIINRKSISPIIAIGLLIALTISGGAAIAVILSQSQSKTPTLSVLGLNGSTTSPILATASIVQITEYPDPLVSKDIVGIEVEVTNLGSKDIYVIDIDVIVGTTLLDLYAEWKIQSSTGAIKVNENGDPYTVGDKIGGYKQKPGTINYFVELDSSDYDNSFARIPATSNLFFAKVKVGNNPVHVDQSIQTQSVALKDFYSPVGYRVALFHHGTETSDARKKLEKVFTDTRFQSITNTKNMNISFDPNIDEYDFSSPTHGINATAVAETYDLVLVAMWAVHNNIANELMEIFNKGVALVFYGTLSGFGNYAQISSQINQTATEEITGLLFDGCSTCDSVKTKNTNANNTYWFIPNGKPGIVADLQPYNVFFEDNKKKDKLGYDIATLTNNTKISTKVYGYHKYELRDKKNSNALFLNKTSPLYVIRETASNKKVATFAMNHKSVFNNKKMSHRFFVPRNLIFAALGEDRKLIRHTKIQMNTFTLTQNPGNTQEFRISWTATVTEGDINLVDGGINFTLYMPTDYSISFRKGKEKKVQVDIETSGSTKLFTKTIKIDLQSNNVIHIDVGHNVSKGKRGLKYLYRNDNLSLILPVRGNNRLKWLRLASGDDPTQVKQWKIVTNWTNVDMSKDTLSVTYNKAIQPLLEIKAMIQRQAIDIKGTKLQKQIVTRINL